MIGKRSPSGQLLTLLFVGVVVQGCLGVTSPDSSDPELPELLDLAGGWIVSLSNGRFFDHLTGEWLHGACELQDLEITLVQADPRFVSSGRREAIVTGSRRTGQLVCRGFTEVSLPAPFGQDTILVVPEGAIDGVVGDCTAGTVLSDCDAPFVPFVDLKLSDVAPVSSAGVHFNLWLGAWRPTLNLATGFFSLRAWEAVGIEGSSSTLILEGTWRATR